MELPIKQNALKMLPEFSLLSYVGIIPGISLKALTKYLLGFNHSNFKCTTNKPLDLNRTVCQLTDKNA